MHLIQRYPAILAILAALLIAGCAHEEGQDPKVSYGPKESLENILANIEINNKPALVGGIDKILQGDYAAASRTFNMALMDDPSNASLHFFNAYTYHMMADAGASGSYDLAEMGYVKALDLENSNWLASLQLGRIKLTQKKYEEAQEHFADVLLFKPDHFEAAYDLAMASYYAYDLRHAAKYINKAVQLRPQEPKARQAAAIILAAAGKSDMAREHLNSFNQQPHSKMDAKYVNQRVADWEKLHKRGAFHLAQADTATINDTEEAPEEAPEEPDESNDKYANMVIVEGVVLRLRHIGNTSKGENVLKVLKTTINFGNRRERKDTGEKVTTWFREFGTENLSDKIEYGLNIANIEHDYVDVIGRPTLVLEAGKEEGSFFSGSELKITIRGEDGGSVETVPFGTNLKVGLTSVDNEHADLNIFFENSALLATTESGVIVIGDTALEIAKSTVQTSLKAKIGETIMLGGLQERLDSHNRNGVPVLGNIPILQYFFAEENTNSSRNSVWFLLTVRKYEPAIKDAKKRLAKKMKQKKHQPNLVALDKRSYDFTEIAPVLPIFVASLEGIFREFRRGDIKPLQFHMKDLEEEMKATLAFLWF